MTRIHLLVGIALLLAPTWLSAGEATETAPQARRSSSPLVFASEELLAADQDAAAAPAEPSAPSPDAAASEPEAAAPAAEDVGVTATLKDCCPTVSAPCGCNPCDGFEGGCYRVGDCDDWFCDPGCCDVYGCEGPLNTMAARFGWWSVVQHNGSARKVGEYQDVESSPFFDVDGLYSDGCRTLDFFASGLDNEANQVGLQYYGPQAKIGLGFQRYIRRLDHDPLDDVNLNLGYGPGIYEQAPTYSPVLPDNISDPQFQGTLVAPGNRTNRAYNGQDLNVGEDYAIRVEQLEGEIAGWLTENLKYRVKAWGQRKFGERQVYGNAHCFNGGLADVGVPASHPFVPGSGGRSCHVISRRQEIDWLTEEIVPSIEGRFGPVTVEYSHTVRAFYQDDQALTRFYTAAGNAAGSNTDEARALGFNISPPAPTTNGTLGDYAFVPENLTHIGQFKLGWELSDCRNVYAMAHAGNTHNNYRETDRNFYGWDLRYMDRSVEDFDTTAYAKMYSENNEFPEFFRYDDLGPPRTRYGAPPPNPWDIADPADFQAPTALDPVTGAHLPPTTAMINTAFPYLRWQSSDESGFIRHPWDYTRTTAGAETRWRPSSLCDGLSLIGGYEYTNWARSEAVVEAFVFDPAINPAQASPGNPDPNSKRLEEFDQGTTVYHTLHGRASMQWTWWLDSYVDYTRRWIHNPMHAVHEPNGTINSGLPTDEDLVKLGGTWYPTNNVMLNGWFGIENRSHSSAIADFDEDNYPIVCSLWYAATPCWFWTAGYGYFTNWIDQDINMGDQIGGFAGNQNTPGVTGRIELAPITNRFEYGGRSHVASLSSRYLVRRGVVLVGGAEYVDSENGFVTTSALWPDLGEFSRVEVNTWRLTAGLDYALFGCVPTYLRYMFYDYEDESAPYNSGELHAILAGASYVF